MSLQGIVEHRIEIGAPADHFYRFFQGQTCPTISQHVHSIEHHNGNWGSHGSVTSWNYTVGGRQETFRKRVEFDETNRTVALVGIGGHIFDNFSSCKKSFKATPNPNGVGSVVTLTIEYEKQHAGVQDPYAYLDFMSCFARDVDVHINRGYYA